MRHHPGFGHGGRHKHHGRHGFRVGGFLRRSFFGRRPFGGCLTLPLISIFTLLAIFIVAR